MKTYYLIPEEVVMYGILYDCPFNGRKKNCCVNHTTSFSFHDKTKWYENLSEKTRKELYHKHNSCCLNRGYSAFYVQNKFI